MKKRFVFFLLALIYANILNAQTTLSAGDIAILQYNSSNPRGTLEVIQFITFKKIESGTNIKFTDNGWTAAGAFRGTTEGIDIWIADRDYSCGEVVVFSFDNIALSTDGDQILVYQGAEATPSFIFAINNEGDAVWQSDSVDTNTSALPTGLTNGVNAVAINEINNAIYNGSLLSGSRPDILTAICTAANWSGNNGSAVTFTGTFNSTSTWDGASWNITGADFFTAIIDGTYSTGANGNFKTCNCTVNATETLTVNSGGTVTVEDNITNNGDITVESGGSVVQVSASGVNSGANYTVERETTVQSSFNVFTYWSTPITAATFAAVAPTTHEYYSFNNATQEWVLGSATTPMNPGIGYALEGPDTGTYPGAQTATFTGAPFNNGNIANTLSFSADGDADNDWNLVGNPYPSAIDADTFINDNGTNIGGTIYFWTHNTPEDPAVNNTEDDYAMYNAAGGTAAVTGGVTPDGNIASGQGFFVQALNAVTVSDFFTNEMRRDADNTSFFKTTKKQKETEKDRIWLNLESETSFSQILVGFFNDATNAVDTKYDGIRFFGKPTLNFYSVINDKAYGIQGTSPLQQTEIIPLGFATNKIGEFTISIDRFEGKLNASAIYIEDALLNTKHNLKTSNYVFNTTTTGTFNNRFKLMLETEETVLNVDVNKLSSNEVLIENTRKGIKLVTLNNSTIKKVAIYDVLGKQLVIQENTSSAVEVVVSKIQSNSILIVKGILDNGDVFVKKIYKN